MLRPTNVILILAVVAAGCSGDSGESGHSDDGTGSVITAHVGAATITKFVKSCVVILSDYALVTQVDSQKRPNPSRQSIFR